jgi:hypothetical protein
MVGTRGIRTRGLRLKGELKVRRKKKGRIRRAPARTSLGISQYSTTTTKPPKEFHSRSKTSERPMVSACDVAERVISGNGVFRMLTAVHPSPLSPESVPAMTMATTIWNHRNPNLKESECGTEQRSRLLLLRRSTPVGKRLYENADRNLRWISMRIFKRGL